MAGGGLSVDHLAHLIGVSGVREIHLGSAACRAFEGQDLGPAPATPHWNRTDARLVAAIVDRVRGPSELAE
jgi:hypothetical protein